MSERLAGDRIALYAISYDTPAVLKSFADRHGITFPLLSDVGSHVICRLGLINPFVRRDHEATGDDYDPKYEGVAFASAFLLDEAGWVVERRFHRDYRVRETGSALARAFQIALPTAVQTTMMTPVVQVRLSAESQHYNPYQMLWLQFDIEVNPGWHIYGRPVPDELEPLSVDVVPLHGVVVGEPVLPVPRLKAVGGFDAPLPSYKGRLTARLPLTFATDEDVDFDLNGRVRFQACTDSECLVPGSVAWSLHIRPGDPSRALR
jgi:hypothetical protein